MDQTLLLSDIALASALVLAATAAVQYMLDGGGETHSSHLSARADRLTLLKQR